MERHLAQAPQFSNSAGPWEHYPSAVDEQDQIGSKFVPQAEDEQKPFFGAKQYTSDIGVTPGIFNRDICDTPESASPASSISGGESLNNHNENKTPPESPGQESVASTPAVHIERLSLDHVRPTLQRPDLRKSSSPSTPSGTSAKRNAPLEAPSAENHHGSNLEQSQHRSSARDVDVPGSKRARSSHVPTTPRRPHGTTSRHVRGQSRGLNPTSGKPYPKPHTQTKFNDSGYGSGAIYEPQRGPTLSTLSETSTHDPCIPRPKIGSYSIKYPGLILQPESSPISKDQLAAEVKGIYAGLVMVEAKCINIDAAQAADPDSKLGPDQWQALIALHRTLLYEHHDFLMATQHPSATPALRGLASKYSMPARMWRHGIHSFLEVLRFRRPQSQDYMLAFIYLAYQMVALLYETVPMFTDTWIECLGDLARYRMAIEENREQHAIWGGVAGRWYCTASDRHPEIGRLYHHLGILERPSVRKFFLYTKSLTCLVPFANAKDSLSTLCTPIIESAKHYYTGDHSTEAGLVTWYSAVSMNCDATRITEAGSEALVRLSLTPSIKARDFGVELVISNIGSLMELGSARNALWQTFCRVINDDIQHSRPSAKTSGPPNPTLTETEKQLMSLSTSQVPCYVTTFVYSAFDHLIRLGQDRQSVRDMLPTTHAILTWFYSLHSLDKRQNNEHDGHDQKQNTHGSLLPDLATFRWGTLAKYLNLVTQHEPIGARTLQFARQGMFLLPERSEDARPLNEDYTMRGLIWTPTFYPPGWFGTQPDDGSRAIETAATHKARFERVQWLALYLGFRIEHLTFDLEKRMFYAPGIVSETVDEPVNEVVAAESQVQEDQPQQQESTKADPGSRTSSTPSAHSDEEGHVVVTTKKRKSGQVSRSGDATTTLSKRNVDNSAVQIVDQDSMQWEQCK